MEWQSTPIFLPGQFHRLRSLGGYSPPDRKKSDMPEQLAQQNIWGAETAFAGSIKGY